MGCLSNHHFVQNDANRKEIRFVRIIVFPKRLRRHIKRRAYIHMILESHPRSGRKPKVGQLPLIAHPQYICRLDIPMNNALLEQILIGCNDLSDNLQRIGFGKLLLLSDVLSQVAMGAVLHHKVVMLRFFYHFVKFDDVLVGQSFVDLDLGLEHLQIGSSELFEVHYFYSVPFVRVKHFNCFKNSSSEPLSKLIILVVFVLLDKYLSLGVVGSSWLPKGQSTGNSILVLEGCGFLRR